MFCSLSMRIHLSIASMNSEVMLMVERLPKQLCQHQQQYLVGIQYYIHVGKSSCVPCLVQFLLEMIKSDFKEGKLGHPEKVA